MLLVGMMGAGKSSVGHAIAYQIGGHYVDNDKLVRQMTGLTPPELAAEKGEEALRVAETDALLHALGLTPPAVAGVAGGAVLDPVNRGRLRSAPAVVWLRARPETLIRRVGTGAGRPWLQPNPARAIRRLAAERDQYYADVADAVVDVDDISAEEAARQVLTAVKSG